MVIKDNNVVTLHYRLQLNDSAGELIEETFNSDPLVFLFGTGQMLPEFERNLSEKKADDEVAFKVASHEAYGAHDSEALVLVPQETFIVDGKLADEFLVPGKIIPMSDKDGNQLRAKVVRVQPDSILLDFNHPMAGKDLFFTVKISSVREATPSELSHGHVHGPGGHHH